MIYLDLIHGKKHSLIELNTSSNNDYDGTITLFRNNTRFNSKLHFLDIQDKDKNILRSKNNLKDIHSFIKSNSYVLKTTISSDDNDSSSKVKNVEWGKYENGIYVTTTEYIDKLKFNFAMLEVEIKS
tara:strand:- start:738 stop:1118 length:381 start_codon:yes stop_codon:yes gene_type:complete